MSNERNEKANEFWNDFYESKNQVWSGNVNPHLVRIAKTLEPSMALDLGCGEGGDAIWLASQGWHVTATDISDVALSRTKTLAEKQQVDATVTLEQHDFEKSFPDGLFNLVSAQFLQSPVEFQRQVVLQKAAAAVSRGGVLLIVEHGGAPSFSEHADHVFPTAKETLASLKLDRTKWKILEASSQQRSISSPTGEIATIVDNVVVVERVEI